MSIHSLSFSLKSKNCASHYLNIMKQSKHQSKCSCKMSVVCFTHSKSSQSSWCLQNGGWMWYPQVLKQRTRGGGEGERDPLQWGLCRCRRWKGGYRATETLGGDGKGSVFTLKCEPTALLVSGVTWTALTDSVCLCFSNPILLSWRPCKPSESVSE